MGFLHNNLCSCFDLLQLLRVLASLMLILQPCFLGVQCRSSSFFLNLELIICFLPISIGVCQHHKALQKNHLLTSFFVSTFLHFFLCYEYCLKVILFRSDFSINQLCYFTQVDAFRLIYIEKLFVLTYYFFFLFDFLLRKYRIEIFKCWKEWVLFFKTEQPLFMKSLLFCYILRC